MVPQACPKAPERTPGPTTRTVKSVLPGPHMSPSLCPKKPAFPSLLLGLLVGTRVCSSSYRNGQLREQRPNSVGTQGRELPQGQGRTPELEMGREDEESSPVHSQGRAERAPRVAPDAAGFFSNDTAAVACGLPWLGLLPAFLSISFYAHKRDQANLPSYY